MPQYTLETPRGRTLTIESDSPDNAVALADKWDLEDHAASEAQRMGVDPSLVLRVMDRESNGNPDAVSPKGAMGPMQLMPDTAKGLGVDPSDPYQNVTGGITYLKQQLDTFHDPRLALAAYNAGPGAVQKYGGVPPFKETQDYVNTIMGPAKAQPAPQMAQQAPQKPAGAPPAPVAAQPAPSVGTDLWKTLVGHPMQAGASLLDSVAPFVGLGPLESLTTTGGRPSALLSPDRLSAPTGTFFQKLVGGVAPQSTYRPQTRPGQYLRTGIDYAPAVLAPGSIPQRLANAVVPGLASETAGQVAHALNAPPAVEQVLRMLGGVAGGAAANTRIVPAANGPAPAPLSLADVKAASDKAWAAVDASTYKVPQATTQAAAQAFSDAVTEAGGAELYPKAAAIAKRFTTLADRGEMTVGQLNRLRSQATTRLFAPGSDEVDMGSNIKGALDNLILNSGDPNVAPARDLYTRQMKMQAVTDAMGSADLTQAGAGAIPGKLKPLIDPKSSQQITNLSPAEYAALRTAVKGNAATNTLAYMDSPFIGTLLKAFTIPTHGGSLVLNMAGGAARAAKNSAAQANAQRVLDLMSLGGNAPPSSAPRVVGFDPLSDPALIGLMPALMRPAVSAPR